MYLKSDASMKFLKSNLFTISGMFLGAAGGYLYYHFVGCSSGTCAITSNPWISTLYGSMMGGLLLNTFQKEKVVVPGAKE
jgi:ABC-type branched-subunit amino acid transport system permease subunit